MRRELLILAALSTIGAIAGCGDESETPTPEPGGGTSTPLTTYTFESRFSPGESSVAYSGQTARHIHIEDLKAYIGRWTDTTFQSANAGDVVGALRYFTDFKNQGGSTSDAIDLANGGMTAAQSQFGEIGSLTSLEEKMPDVDAGFDLPVIGWETDADSPSQVLSDMLEALEALVLQRVGGNLPTDPSGSVIAKPFVSADGVDYQQLLQKYLTGAIAYSQGADDYLDDDIDGKGLLSDNTAAVEGQPYTALEHQWDEGFGYFGAARNFGDYTDEEVAEKGGRADWQRFHDTNGDGLIDFRSEFNFGHATNASKRDLGSNAAIDLSGDAFEAFIAGRKLIAEAEGALSAAELDALRAYRDTAVAAWEQAIAATVVHYINDTLADMAAFGTSDYSFLDHAKHWSELKGFALALQFNRNHSIITRAELQSLHDFIGTAPVLPTAEASTISDYADALRSARSELFDIYGFDSSNLGDADGNGGW